MFKLTYFGRTYQLSLRDFFVEPAIGNLSSRRQIPPVSDSPDLGSSNVNSPRGATDNKSEFLKDNLVAI